MRIGAGQKTAGGGISALDHGLMDHSVIADVDEVFNVVFFAKLPGVDCAEGVSGSRSRNCMVDKDHAFFRVVEMSDLLIKILSVNVEKHIMTDDPVEFAGHHVSGLNGRQSGVGRKDFFGHRHSHSDQLLKKQF